METEGPLLPPPPSPSSPSPGEDAIAGEPALPCPTQAAVDHDRPPTAGDGLREVAEACALGSALSDDTFDAADRAPFIGDGDDSVEEATESSELASDTAAAAGFAEEHAPQEAPVAPTGAAVLSDDLRDRIVRQVEYYLSDENLPTDKFLLKYVNKNKEGFVPIALIASFRRMKKLTQDLSLVVAALRTSTKLILSKDGKRVRRQSPLVINEASDAMSHTVVVENLEEGQSIDDIHKIFSKIGNIVKITICDPHSVDESDITNKPKLPISMKVHALVEYETVVCAENAVASLNDEKNWRSGIRVEMLLKRMAKLGLTSKKQKGTSSGKKGSLHETGEQKAKSLDDHNEMTPKEDGEQVKFLRKKNRYNGQGRGHIQSMTNGHGHGGPSGSGAEYVSKPVAGPRMPDGTRGFAVGRGRPTTSD